MKPQIPSSSRHSEDVVRETGTHPFGCSRPPSLQTGPNLHNEYPGKGSLSAKQASVI